MYFHFHFCLKVCVPATKLAIQTSSLCASAVSCVRRAPGNQSDQRCLDLLGWPSSQLQQQQLGRWCSTLVRVSADADRLAGSPPASQTPGMLEYE